MVDMAARTKGHPTVKRRSAAALLGTALLTAVALAPSAAVPGTSAHRSGYAGYGCYGWSESGPWPWDEVNDCYAGQVNYPNVLIRHTYRGWGCPGDYYSWERLY